MRPLVRVSALILAGMLATPALAQYPATNVGPRTPQSAAVRRDAPPHAYQGAARRETSRYSGYYDDARRAGYRNPGGVGRYAEFYPAGNQFQNDQARNPPPVATFNGGSGVPTMDQQIAAQQLGVAKYNSIQQSIDRYARPYYGYGFGFGGFY
jgi:hypothetical protein